MTTNNNLKLAIQKQGRLTEETLEFLRKSGLEFESYRKKLFSLCRNFPLEILYVRNDDISDYVSSGIVDLGIVGQNTLYEERPKVKKLLNLRFGFCSLFVAVLKESAIKKITDLEGKTVATSYPVSARKFFEKNRIKVNIFKISGSVELAPALGVAEAIVDLVSTGSTLALNDLRMLTKIYDSEAVLIANKETIVDNNLLLRFQSVLSAKNYKSVLMDIPPEVQPKIKKLVPGLKNFLFSTHVVIKEDVLWEMVGKFKELGVSKIIVMPIEKMII